MTDTPHEQPFDRLKHLLREMFQLDRGDLDFGLYRIMNLKAAEIDAFLERDLLPQVKTTLAGITEEQLALLNKEIERTRKAALELGVDPDKTPKMIDLNEQLAEARADAEAEAEVYGHLANFFERYYNEGDFMSQRRYSGGGESTYLIPHDGEEVKLHWANADQYYVKTTENYAAYAFVAGEADAAFRVRFEIAAANNEKDNIKAPNGRQRRFVLARNPAALEDGELVVRFEHRPLREDEKQRWGNGARQQCRIDAHTTKRVLARLESLAPEWLPVLAAPTPTEADPERCLLAKHVGRYAAKNSFDYFIHKDLGGFLRRELDLYLKTDVLDLQDLALGNPSRLRRAINRMRAARAIGEKIIAFLAQLEDFQKRLWLKKKFVLETQWCVTLDRVPEALYPEIVANEAQVEEWRALFAIDEIASADDAPLLLSLAEASPADSEEIDLAAPLSPDFLKANPYLVLDTRHFDHDFKDRLLAALSEDSPLDEQTDGFLIHGENFQALNLLQAGYRKDLDCIYIDPPYNTGDSEILYKNGYMRSSWLSLMANCLDMVNQFMANESVLFVAIDDFEMVNLAKLMDSQYPWLQREMIIVNHHPQGGKANVLASTHEYMIVGVLADSSKELVGRPKCEDQERRPFKRSGTAESNFRHARKNSFFAILVDPDSRKVVGLEPPPADSYSRERTPEGLIRIYPIGNQGEERVWRRSYESCQSLVRQNKLICSNGGTIYQLIEAGERKSALFSNWVDSRYNAGTHGANLLGDILGDSNQFAYPKSIHTVGDAVFAADIGADATIMDYFAGSGTTGHAVIDLNREDGGARKYVLVEMGDHFDTVLLPRLKKIVHAPEWKDGKPQTRNKGVSQLIRYVRLESYEDAMDGLVLTPAADDLLASAHPDMAEDYRLRYALEEETSDSPCLLGQQFTDPFRYLLPVVRDGERHETPVDLPETFNLLLGLRVASRRCIEGVLVITGQDAERQSCVILWRNLSEFDNEALERWFTANRAALPESPDIIYANGDHTLNAVRQKGETWRAMTIEPLFRELMFAATTE